MNDKYIVDALQHALENISGKTLPTKGYCDIVDMLNAFNKTYYCNVGFQKTPTTAEVVVKDAKGNIIASNANGKYMLKAGSYTYTATAEGYEPYEGNFTVKAGDLFMSVKFTMRANS